MPYGNPVHAPLCGRCKQKIEMAVLPEAVYQDGRWWHTACHREGTAQLFRATPLSEVLPAGKRGGSCSTRPCSRTMLRLDGTRLRRSGVLASPLTGVEHTVSDKGHKHERGEGAEPRRPAVLTPTSGPEEKPSHAGDSVHGHG